MGTFRIVAACGALLLAACAGDPYGGPKQNTGAAVGGIIGGAIGASLDERDRQFAYEAHMRALQYGEPGAPVGWRSPDTGHYGTIVPGPPYQTSGTTCREYSHTIYIDGRPQTARGTACRNPDGSWTPLS